MRSLLRAPVSEMTYIVLSGTLNSTLNLNCHFFGDHIGPG